MVQPKENFQNPIIHCNIKEQKKRSKGPLTTKEIDLQLTKMILDNQSRSELDPAFNEIKEALNLKKNKQGLYECCGRIIGDYPIFVLRNKLLAEKMVEKAHYQALDRGVTLTCGLSRVVHIESVGSQKIEELLEHSNVLWQDEEDLSGSTQITQRPVKQQQLRSSLLENQN